jgi:cell shape-determining protein MreC
MLRAGDALAQLTHRALSNFGTVSAVELQNENLTQQNALLAAENQALQDKVQSITGLAADGKSVIAGVITRPPVSPYDTLVIAAGSAEGISVGMEAFGGGSIPLGTVSSVLEHFSRITLFSAPGTSVLGWVSSKRTPVILKGEGGGALSASVPRSAGIISGDSVSVSGPGSIPIGTVVQVDIDPSAPSASLRIAPKVNLFAINWVSLRDTGKSLQSALSSTTLQLP